MRIRALNNISIVGYENKDIKVGVIKPNKGLTGSPLKDSVSTKKTLSRETSDKRIVFKD